MKKYKVDLHIHSKWAYRTSPALTIDAILKRARELKLDGVGTGDILHTTWRNSVLPYLADSEVTLFLTTEVAIRGIHYLLIFPDISTVESMYALLKPRSKDIDTNGRCNLRIQFIELRDLCQRYRVLFGLAHAFAPCGHYYKWGVVPSVDFIEPGLAVAKRLFNYIQTPFSLISSSDAHSITNIGRAYTVFECENLDYAHLKQAILQRSYTLVTGIAEVNRYYGSGKRRGVNETVQYITTLDKVNNYEVIEQLTPEEIITLKYNVKKTSKRFMKLYNEAITDPTTQINILINFEAVYIKQIGKDGIAGKLQYRPLT